MTDTAAELTASRSWIQPFYRNFNGLRAIAVLTVYVCHLGHLMHPSNAWTALFFGNDLFFVLSGFLITGLLLDSVNKPRYFENFYVRRALRIFPVFYGFFLLLYLLRPFLHLYWHSSLILFCLYAGNLFVPFMNLTADNPTIIYLARHASEQPIAIANIGHLWSLCVEEQFYLFWPAVIFVLRDRKKLLVLCLVALPLTFALRALLAVQNSHAVGQYLLYWSTFTRWDTLLAGAALAVLLRMVKLHRVLLHRLGWFCFVAGALGYAASFRFNLVTFNIINPGTGTVGLSALALLGVGALLLALDDQAWYGRVLQSRPMQYMGTISYGFYVFHGLLITAVDRVAQLHPGHGVVLFGAYFAFIFVLAAASYHLYESRFLRLKDILAPHGARKQTQTKVATPRPLVQGWRTA